MMFKLLKFLSVKVLSACNSNGVRLPKSTNNPVLTFPYTFYIKHPIKHKITNFMPLLQGNKILRLGKSIFLEIVAKFG